MKSVWDKEKVISESKKYNSRSEFNKKSYTAYKYALKYNLLDEMSWLKRPKQHNKIWDYNKVIEESKKYHSRNDFLKGCKSAYEYSRKNNLLDEMTWLKPKYIKWDYNKVIEESKKYNSRSEFQKQNTSAYGYALKNNLLDEMTWLKPQNLYGENAQKKDNIYVYEFLQFNSVYVGRTIRPSRRFNEHKIKGTVFNFCKKHNIKVPTPKIVETNLTIYEGRIREYEWIEIYKSNGWNVINKAKCGAGCGSLGSINKGKWSKKKVFEESKKYHSRTEFQKQCYSAYRKSLENNWLDEMTWLNQIHKTWSKESVFEESKKYKTKSEFRKNSMFAYKKSLENNWLNEMTWFKNNHWDKEKIFTKSKEFTSISEMRKKSQYLYRVSLKNNWLDEMTWLH